MSQPARFAQRSRILTDVTISASACRLFLLLDDQAKGDDSIKIKQRRLAVLLGLDTRQLKRLIIELTAAKYLRIKRTILGNVYDFDRTKMSLSEVTKMSPRMGQKCPLPPYGVQEILQEPPLPPASGGIRCAICLDSPRRIPVSRDGRAAVKRWCPACGGARRSA